MQHAHVQTNFRWTKKSGLVSPLSSRHASSGLFAYVCVFSCSGHIRNIKKIWVKFLLCHFDSFCKLYFFLSVRFNSMMIQTYWNNKCWPDIKKCFQYLLFWWKEVWRLCRWRWLQIVHRQHRSHITTKASGTCFLLQQVPSQTNVNIMKYNKIYIDMQSDILSRVS